MTLKKSQRILSMLLAVIMVLSLTTVFEFQKAYADEIDGEWRYTVSGGKANITSYIGTATTITVPARVNGIAVRTVSGLSKGANVGKVASITLSEGIEEIAAGAFENYSALEIVKLPATLKTVGSNAFYNCTRLRAVTLPKSVTSIGSSAFCNCSSLISAHMDCGASVIPDNLFTDCVNLSSVILPSGASSIGKNAFSNCSSLYSIVLPDSITEIKGNAFSNCTKLTLASLPAELKTMGENCFANCSSISSLMVGNKLRTIGTKAFQNCTSLTDIYFGCGLTKIEKNIFFGCKQLKKVVFGGSYVNLTNAFDINSNPTVYYPSKLSTEWSQYSGTKKTFSSPAAIKFTASSSMTAGEKQTIKLTITPNLSTLGSVYFLSSSNESVATINKDGVISALSGGTTKITATTITGLTKSFTLKVNPRKITSVTATSKTTSSIDLKWTADTSANGYMVYRSTSASSGFKKVATTYTNSYTDKGLKKGTTYYYKIYTYIKTSDGYLYSPASAAKSAKATSPAPATITAKKASTTSAKITWTKSIGATGYQVCMATSINGTYTVIKNVTSGTTLSTTKTGLKKGQTYYFKVRSYVTVNGTKVYSGFSKVTKITL